MTTIDYRDYEKMSPFEIKDGLIKLAKRSSQKSAQVLLYAGRGNPNWIATKPREGFFLLRPVRAVGSRVVRWTIRRPVSPGMPQQKDIAERFKAMARESMRTDGGR